MIFENCYLTYEQKVKLCQICGEVRADYVKTSTGYGSGGATHEDLILMRKSAPARQAQGSRRRPDARRRNRRGRTGLRPARGFEDRRDSRRAEISTGAVTARSR